MTTTTAPFALSTGSRFGGLLEAVGAFFDGIREGNDMARRYEILSRLSDAELAHRGLSRDVLAQVVVHGKPL